MQGLTRTDSTSANTGFIPGKEVAYTRACNQTLTNRYLQCIIFVNEIACNKSEMCKSIQSLSHNKWDMDCTHPGSNRKNDIYGIYKLWDENRKP